MLFPVELQGFGEVESRSELQPCSCKHDAPHGPLAVARRALRNKMLPRIEYAFYGTYFLQKLPVLLI
jgi:hypothetical protein